MDRYPVSFPVAVGVVILTESLFSAKAHLVRGESIPITPHSRGVPRMRARAPHKSGVSVRRMLTAPPLAVLKLNARQSGDFTAIKARTLDLPSWCSHAWCKRPCGGAFGDPSGG